MMMVIGSPCFMAIRSRSELEQRHMPDEETSIPSHLVTTISCQVNFRRNTMKRNLLVLSSIIAVSVMAMHSGQARAASPADMDCKLQFSLTSWSILYKQSAGEGVVTCENGQSMHVNIVAKGGGLTVGKSEIRGGTGRFSYVYAISDVLGRYGEAEAHAGAGKSGTAQVLTKGSVSLALAGTGHGVDLGVDVGEFTLTRVK
jgi:hypothetical protein